ncbi:hypothetical protein [Streptomyces sp. NPDC057677]|uniref:hypothetical protein n=1 Tax=unclassified Streptomyces TaxID=2593676 RepID=UPI00367736BC
MTVDLVGGPDSTEACVLVGAHRRRRNGCNPTENGATRGAARKIQQQPAPDLTREFEGPSPGRVIDVYVDQGTIETDAVVTARWQPLDLNRGQLFKQVVVEFVSDDDILVNSRPEPLKDFKLHIY